MIVALERVHSRSDSRLVRGRSPLPSSRWEEVGQKGVAAVSCLGVTKEFGERGTKTLALRGVDLQVDDGQLTLLVGPSGCGKTTLISIIAGLLNPTEGSVGLFG